MKIPNPFPFLRRNKELVLGILAILLGSGGIAYTTDTEDKDVVIRHHQGQQTANNTLDIQAIKKRLRELEEHHP